jgi:peptidyl-tRNA hydrolase
MHEALNELWGVLEEGNLLDAEVQVAGLLALPALNQGSRADAQEFVGALIAAAARKQPASSAAAFYRLLMALGTPSVKKMASGALREITSSGAYPPGWVTEIGKPVPGQAWHRYNVFGDEEAVVITFAYGEAQHGLLVRIDRTVLPTATVIGISPEPEQLVSAITGEGSPLERTDQVSLAVARILVEEPLARAAQGGGRGLTPSSVTFLPLARAHVKRLPVPEDAPEGGIGIKAYTSADRVAAVDAFLASPQAAEAGDAEVARFWAQALTGYSGRIASEPPGQVGPRKLAAMLGHVASSFALTQEQRTGMERAVTAWTTWAAGNQGLEERATEQLLAAVPKALEEFPAAYDDPRTALARAYVSDLATSDADVTELGAAVTRRTVAVPLPEMNADGTPAMDVASPAVRAEMVAREFAQCGLADGQAREDLVDGATRVVEELWSGQPAATWEAARKLLTEGRSRHDAIHALVRPAG